MRVSSIALIRPTNSARLVTRLLSVFAVAVMALVGGALPARAASVAPASPSLAAAVGTGSISGTVTDESTGLPIQDVCVTVSSPEQADPIDPVTVCTGADGTYEVPDLPIDRPLAVRFTPPPGSWYVAEAWQGWRNQESWDPIYLAEGETRTDIDARLVTGGRLSGHVTNSAGAGLPGIDVILTRTTEWGFSAGTVVRTDANGDYLTPVVEVGAVGVTFSDTAGPYLDLSIGDVTITAGETTSPVDGVMDAGGTVSGLISNPDGTPASGACVLLESVTGGPSSPSRCLGDDGLYTTAGVPTGDYYVQFSSIMGPGFFPTQYLGGTLTTAGATVVHVTAGTDAPDRDHTIVLGGVISGQITAASTGLGVSACVSAVQGSEWNWVGSACSDPEGYYRIVGLPTGTYQVRIDPNDPALTGEWFHDQTTFPMSTPVEVTFGSATTLDESLSPAASVSGLVVDGATGAPIANAMVALRTPPVQMPGGPPPVPGFTFYSAHSDASGHYTITGAPAGTYLVVAFADGFLTEWYDNQTAFFLANTVPVAEGASVTGIDFGLTKLASVQLLVTNTSGTPLPGISVTLWSESGGGNGFVTDGSGRVMIPSFVPGNYTIEFTDPSGTYPHQFYDRTLTRETATTVPILAGSVVALTAVLIGGPPPPSISGTVLDDPTGDPIPGATVNAFALTGDVPVASTTTDASGNFTLSPLASGSYLVEVIPADPATHLAEWFENVSDRASATQVSTDGPVTALDIRLARARVSASGTVTDAQTGLPLAGVSVAAYLPAGTEPIATATTDDQGRYTIANLPPGSYTVRFEVAHYTPFDVNVDLTATRTDVDAALTPLPGSISGTITGAGGNKDRACVQVWALDGVTKVGAPVCVAGGGTYTVSDLVPSSYLVSVTQKNDQTTWYVRAASPTTATAVVVGPEAAVAGIDISVRGKPKA